MIMSQCATWAALHTAAQLKFSVSEQAWIAGLSAGSSALGLFITQNIAARVKLTMMTKSGLACRQD